jgi:mono/diheme cytochrome c family protein
VKLTNIVDRAWATSRRIACVCAAVSLLAVTAAVAAPGSRHGPAASDAAVFAAQAQGISVWDGVYTDAQARRGQRLYAQECANCHHDDRRGEGSAPSLVGPSFFFRWGDLSLDDMLTATRTTMPQGAPGSLGLEAYLDVISFLLESNGIPPGMSELPQERDDLRRIVVRERSVEKEP